MEKIKPAILKTLIYYDLFDWPLTAPELSRYLIGQSSAPQAVTQALEELVGDEKIIEDQGLYTLPGKENNLRSRLAKQSIALEKSVLAQKAADLLKSIPWIEMVGLTGALAIGDADAQDDIDFIILTSGNRLYLSRLFEFMILTFRGIRRRAGSKEVKDKICPNLYLDRKGLKINENLCAAHDLVRMQPLWERNGAYQALLQANPWYRNYFPNWQPDYFNSQLLVNGSRNKFGMTVDEIVQSPTVFSVIGDWFEKLARRFQWWYLSSKQTTERISAHALYFHPRDMYPPILQEYNRRINLLDKNRRFR